VTHVVIADAINDIGQRGARHGDADDRESEG